MNIQLTGKITMFVEKRTTEDGKKFSIYTTNLSRDYGEGKRLSMSIQVYFAKSDFCWEYLDGNFREGYCYTLKLNNAWLTLRSYFDKMGESVVEPCIQIKSMEILKATEIDKEKRDVARTLGKMQKEAPKSVPSPMGENPENPDDPLSVIDDDLPF